MHGQHQGQLAMTECRHWEETDGQATRIRSGFGDVWHLCKNTDLESVFSRQVLESCSTECVSSECTKAVEFKRAACLFQEHRSVYGYLQAVIPNPLQLASQRKPPAVLSLAPPLPALAHACVPLLF